MKSTQEITRDVQERGRWSPALREQVSHVVVGQKYLVDRLLLGLLANGHILLEGVPGLAKTLTVKTLAAAIRTGFQRLQFTPDLLPADLIGTLVYNPREGVFTTDRKSTRLNSSHVSISYAVFCLKKKKKKIYRYY